MDLKNFLPRKEEEVQYFWSLIIEPEWVSAGVWRLLDGKVQVIAISPPSPWNLDEELVSACDVSCSSVVQNFPEDLEAPSKTVFGVVSSWVDGGEIKSDYLGKIKKVCTELTLTPVGFVVLSEALSNYLKSEEGGSVNAIFLGISQGNVELSIFRLGKLVGVSQIARSVSVVEDVTEGLSRFYSGEAFPSRIILYNSKEGELEDIRQELIKADWENFSKVKFLHTPKIEIIPPEKKIHAVCLAGGAEMEDVKKVVALPSAVTDGRSDLPLEENLPDLPAEEIQNLEEPAEKISPEDFGFEVDTDESGFSATSVDHRGIPQQTEAEPKPQLVENTGSDKMKRGEKFRFPGFFARFRFPKLNLPKFSFGFGTGKKPIVLGILFLVLLAVGLFAFWWFVPKAEITVFVSPKRIEEELDISVDPSADSSDFDLKVIAGEVIKSEEVGEKSSPTSGTKTVGDKATGEITIYRSGSTLNIAKNTVVKGPGNLEFTLDQDVTIASGSVLTRGITKAKVTAKEFGAQYNLASGTTFTVSNYSSSDIEATNESAFSGGTSREVSAVSEADLKNLLKDLQDSLEGKIRESLIADMVEDRLVIEDSIEYSVIKKEYDKKVGDEATSLKLKLTLSGLGVSVKKSEVEELGLKHLSQSVPSGYNLKNDQIESDFSFISKKDDIYTLSLFIGTDLLPQTDTDEIKRNVTGKYPEAAEDYMNENVPGFERAVIKFTNISLPGRLGSLPRVPGNIEISVSAEK